MNREVNLTKRVKTAKGVRFCPVVLSANGRVKPDWVLVDDKPERHPEGRYYLDWYDGARRIRRSVGKDAATADAKRQRQEQTLRAVGMGIKVVPQDDNAPTLRQAVSSYLSDIKLDKKAKTYAAYSRALSLFLETCKAQQLSEITRRDMIQFSAYLRVEKKQSPRSVWNKSLMSCLS